MTVIEYVTEEVRRQGHDIDALDGIERVGWMLDAWSYVLRYSREVGKPELADVVLIGKRVERIRNAKGLRKCRVMVGLCPCPDPEEIPRLLSRLFGHRDRITSMEFYKEFELIHPFVDGNGRTGKILLNWLNGTLLAPIFPPNDLFGEPIRNP